MLHYTERMFKTAQKTLRTAIVLCALFFTVFFLSIGYFVLGFHHEQPIPTRLSFWLEHAFSTGEKDLSELSTSPLTDLYIHAGPLNADGTLPGDLALSKEELNVEGKTVYAWLGQIRSKIDLEDASVRKNILDSATFLLSAGFEGIHLDIEPVQRDDEAFFTLLEELRAQHPTAKLSVAMDEWQPHGLSQWIADYYDVSIESYWSTEQVEQVLPFIDQLVVMTYDTGFKDPRLYAWWVEQQTVALSSILEDSTVELFIGIPSYSQGSHFDPNVENVSTGLAGFKDGVDNVRSAVQSITGVAVYSYWEMSEEEWKILKSFYKE